MTLFGITGGIGMGKSNSARILADWGVPVLDTDILARELVQPGQPALGEIVEAFGSTIIGENGSLNRSHLAEIVFSDSEKRKILEAILHPKIRAIWLAQTELWRKTQQPRGAVVIPLLFEIGAEDSFDAVICVACTEITQSSRLRLRGWSLEQIKRRREAQWPIDQKAAMSDYVIWTEGELDVHAQQLSRIMPITANRGN